jgi:protein ImuB
MRLLRLRLEVLGDALDPGFGFDLIRLEAHGRTRLDPVARSLIDGEMDESDVAALIDRLSVRYGAAAITRPVFHESHMPERAADYVEARDWRRQDMGLSAVRTPRRVGEPPTRPLRLFDPPILLDVIAEVPDGPPLKFRFRRVLHDVVHAEGPERIAGEWWHEPDAPTRDYFKVEDAGGRRFWLYRAGLYGAETDRPRWFMHGLFA